MHADTYDFTLTGADNAPWQLSASPTPDGSEDGVYFELWDVLGSFMVYVNSGPSDTGFFSTAQGCGLRLADFYAGNVARLICDGPQLYTGC